MNFFLDIFNQLFKINEQEIFIIFDVDGNIWFKFKDVLKVLGYTSTLKQSNIFNIDNNFQKNHQRNHYLKKQFKFIHIITHNID